jgi:predicted  nucleic acid-binding Zn ribbon protein
MLRDTLTENPLQCVECNGEVAPERIGFDESLAQEIANWRSVFRSLFLLWLDSGEYESWAAERLCDANGEVNRRGLDVAAQLNQFVRAYYWWFKNTGVEDPPEMTNCPICRSRLETVEGRQFQKCEACSVLV